MLSSCVICTVKKAISFSKVIPRLYSASRPRSRSNVPTVAQVVLVLVVFVEMGLIHPVQCANYTVGAGYTDTANIGTGLNSTWTNTVGGLVKPDVLEAAYQQWADSVNVAAGDTLSKLLLHLLVSR
jgi:hypothetical protein